MEVVPRENQHASTIASHLMDFTRMNPPIFFGSKVDEDPHDILDEAYMILLAMWFSNNETPKLVFY